MPALSLRKIAILVVVLVGVVLCIRQIHEPDVWWQIRTGEYIIEHSEVPKVDVFSYTHEGEPWLNVKWFTEVLMATTVKIFGAENLMLLQMLVLGIVIFLIIKHTKLLYNELKSSALTIAILALLLAFSFRINGRPEMMSHLFTCLFILIYQQYRFQGGKMIFTIILLQAVWANMHEAFGVGYAVSIIFVSGFWFDKLIHKSEVNPVIPTVVLVASILAVSINPNGTSLIMHPYEIYTQLSDNQFTTENLNWTNKEYWEFSSIVFVIIMLMVLSTILSNKKGNILNHINTNYGTGYIVLLAAFFYLGLGANRNTPYFMFAVFPLLYEFFTKFIKIDAAAYKKTIGVGLVFYLLIVSGQFYKLVLPREAYGLKVNVKKNAVGAAKFIEDNNIKGKAFTDYLSSSYLLWRLQPDFKTYLDLRDLDVFSPKFIENVFVAFSQPDAIVNGETNFWDYICSADDFNYVVVLNNEVFNNYNRFMNKVDKNYMPVYADGLSTVYLKNSKENKKLIDAYSYKGNDDFFKKFPEGDQNELAKGLTYLFNPFFKDEYTDKRYRQEKRAYFKIIN